jgi:alkylation response protein AidB-like acyl-CoA dehydrogenase
MTEVKRAWGAGPSARYEDLAARFRPVFARIRATAVERDLARRLPADELGWLKDAGFPKLRLPAKLGGFDATLPELFALLIELSAADSNVTNALRTHFGFTERALVSEDPEWGALWLGKIAAGQIIAGAYTEAGDAKVGAFSTRLIGTDRGWRLNGEKYYTTGSLFADWLMTSVNAEDSDIKIVLADRRASGVEVLDDWNGFGQALTSSGTARFRDVAIGPEQIAPNEPPLQYAAAFYQLVHIATLAGIGRAAAADAARLVAERKRVFSNANASRVSADPQILQVVGRVRAAAYSAGAIALKAAEATQRVYDAYRLGDPEVLASEATIADVEINQSISAVTNLILDATTILFDALGASATARDNGLDRYWRNARTISSHNPRIYRERSVGDFAVNGAKPPTEYRAGAPEAEPQPAATSTAPDKTAA